MKKNPAGKTRGSLAKQLSKRMSVLYCIIYLLILALIVAALTPLLYINSNTRALNVLELMFADLTNAQESVSDYVNALYNSEAFLNGLSAYSEEPSEKNMADVELALSTFVSSNNRMLAVSVEDQEHNFFNSNYFNNVVNQDSLSDDAQYQKLFSYSSGSYYSFISSDEFYAVTLPEGDVSTFSTLVYTVIMSFNQDWYIVRAYYSLNTVFSDFNSQAEGTFSNYALIDVRNGGGVLYTLHDSKTNWAALSEYTSSKEHFFAGGGYCYYALDPTSGWALAAYSPLTVFYSQAVMILATVACLYLISPVLYTVLLIPTVKKYLAPLSELTDSMSHYSAGDEPSLHLKTDNEIETLNESYNEMIEKINSQILDIRNKEQINAVTNFKLLATQLDPHFVYNTMNVVNIMAKRGETDSVVEINNALIHILRARLSSKLSVYTTIERELETLKEYNLIMFYRYGSKVRTVIDADPDLMDTLIPVNIFQPLAENSFYHGFADLSEDTEGEIDLLIYSMDGRLEIEFSDNGCGIEPERLEILRTSSYRIYDDEKPHIGIDNIRQRLSYLYGDDYEFDIHSVPGYGTTITMSLPLNAPAG